MNSLKYFFLVKYSPEGNNCNNGVLYCCSVLIEAKWKLSGTSFLMTNNIIIILIEIKNEGTRWMTCMAMFHGLPIIMGFLLHFIENLFFFLVIVSNQPAGTNIMSNVNLL